MPGDHAEFQSTHASCLAIVASWRRLSIGFIYPFIEKKKSIVHEVGYVAHGRRKSDIFIAGKITKVATKDQDLSG